MQTSCSDIIKTSVYVDTTLFSLSDKVGFGMDAELQPAQQGQHTTKSRSCSHFVIPDETQAAAFEVVGLDVVIPGFQSTKQSIKQSINQSISQSSNQSIACHTSNNNLKEEAKARMEITVIERVKQGKECDSQVDGEELKGDAEVVAEGQAFPDMHYTRAAITVLHTHTPHYINRPSTNMSL